MKPVILTLLLAAGLGAQEMPRWNKVWMASAAGLGAATAADIASSYGRVGGERNPVFGETFTARDAAVKVGVVGGVVLVQYLVIRQHPDSRAAKVFSTINFGVAGATAGVAARNWRIQ